MHIVLYVPTKVRRNALHVGAVIRGTSWSRASRSLPHTRSLQHSLVKFLASIKPCELGTRSLFRLHYDRSRTEECAPSSWTTGQASTSIKNGSVPMRSLSWKQQVGQHEAFRYILGTGCSGSIAGNPKCRSPSFGVQSRRHQVQY